MRLRGGLRGERAEGRLVDTSLSKRYERSEDHGGTVESDVQFQAIAIATMASDRDEGETTLLTPSLDNESMVLFSLDDPFGIRKAVVPLFWMESNGDLQGLGTAFVIDPWGGLTTADHVIADARLRGIMQHDRSGDFRINLPSDTGLVALHGYGVVFGTVGLPPAALRLVSRIWSPALPGSDPIAALQGRPDYQAIDLAFLTTQTPSLSAVRNLRLRSNPPQPKPGDVVVAIGYPRIETFKGSQDEARTTISEGMKAAYGRVVQLHPHGRDRSNPTPVFEIEANWPSGMSGGPVFNSEGEVIGLVSRSIAPETEDGLGTAWATWLQAFPELPDWAPTLDRNNSDWRRGWAVVRKLPWHLAGVFGSEERAREVAECAGADYVVSAGAWRLGSDDFVEVC